MQQQFEQLKRINSLQLEEDMLVLWPGNREPTPFKVSNIVRTAGKGKTYAFTSQVIAFVYDEQLYVTPNTKESLNIIRDAGFKLREFHVPFSRGARPIGEFGEKWQNLIAKVKPSSKATSCVA